MSNFFTSSKTIANNFLQNIVFIDDKAFENPAEPGNHDFDAYEVTNLFAREQKICAIYNPKTLDDIECLATLSKKADVTVLDWQINLERENVPVEKEEEDEEEEDPRGPHTLKIIRSILADNITLKSSIKLIIIYTGEIDLEGIAESVYKDLEDYGIQNLTRNSCEVAAPNFKIQVIAKPDNELDENGEVKSKFRHSPELNDRVKQYAELPEYIAREFTLMTSGLLSNFVLQSLSILRNNTFRLIKLYNKNLDFAFMNHRLLLPEQDDSRDQLIDIFADSIRALLQYNQADNSISADNIKDWVDSQNLNKTITVRGHDIILNQDFIKDWVDNGFVNAVINKLNSDGVNVNDDLSKSINKYFNDGKLHNENTLLLTDDAVNYEMDFSILTHHKSIFKPEQTPPKLSLGTIVKGENTGYWVCIQQKCDSVRLNANRRFLFLPLKVLPDDAKKGFQFVTGDNKKLSLSIKTYELRTIKFKPAEGQSSIIATSRDDKYYFEPIYNQEHPNYNAAIDENFEWVFDLKDLHAQRVANDFAREISRVGLDESEWLRHRAK